MKIRLKQNITKTTYSKEYKITGSELLSVLYVDKDDEIVGETDEGGLTPIKRPVKSFVDVPKEHIINKAGEYELLGEFDNTYIVKTTDGETVLPKSLCEFPK